MDDQQNNPQYIIAELVQGSDENQPQPLPPSQPRVALPVMLFIATCLSTFMVGGISAGLKSFVPPVVDWSQFLSPDFITIYPPVIHWNYFLWGGFCYAAPLMTILICHEAGHFIQARRYHVSASFPYFIPVPLPPIGTMGAVIGMSSNMRDRKALFDIGITGPLAGLVPTIIFCVLGLSWSNVAPLRAGIHEYFGEPLLFKLIIRLTLGDIPAGHDVFLHPTAFAGWVGLLITSLNLFPIGQLDGGHVFYSLLLKKSYIPASMLLNLLAVGAIIMAFGYGNPMWILMIMLLFMMGPYHPPTANDYVSLGWVRTVLGWLTLAFVLIGFTPMPFFLIEVSGNRPVKQSIEQPSELHEQPWQRIPPRTAPPAEEPADEEAYEYGQIVRFRNVNRLHRTVLPIGGQDRGVDIVDLTVRVEVAVAPLSVG
ncbi:MAG: site-2 protease family protein [Pirellulales bacterium]|nr:site-2 protease family protein [Pirellulales bacterium]